MSTNSKILVVEDSEAISQFYQYILESKGHKVVVASDGKSELEIYEDELSICGSEKPPFDLVISDNSMPEINGTEAGKKILDLVPDQKFFFVTGETSTILKLFNVDGKNIDVEQKPIVDTVFLKKVECLLAN